MLRWIIRDRPGRKIDEVLWIARVCGAKRPNDVTGEIGTFGQQIACGPMTGRFTVELSDNVDVGIGANALHFFQVLDAVWVEVVVASHIDQEGPGFFCGVRQ